MYEKPRDLDQRDIELKIVNHTMCLLSKILVYFMENAADLWQKNHRAVQCEACYYWLHIKCEGISPAEYIILCCDDDPWICNDCSNFQFSDSFLENDVSTASELNDLIDCDIFETAILSKAETS